MPNEKHPPSSEHNKPDRTKARDFLISVRHIGKFRQLKNAVNALDLYPNIDDLVRSDHRKKERDRSPSNSYRSGKSQAGRAAVVAAAASGLLTFAIYGKIENGHEATQKAQAVTAVRKELAQESKHCVGSGERQVEVLMTDYDQLSLEGFTKAVMSDHDITHGNCTFSDLEATLSTENAIKNPGLLPEPFFDPSEFTFYGQTYYLIVPNEVREK